MTGSAPLRWTFHAESNSIEGEESEEREGSAFFAGREAGGFMLDSIFVHRYSVWSTQGRKLNL